MSRASMVRIAGSGLAAGAAGLTTYLLAVRPWHLRWGATEEEIDRVMPLDDRVQHPTYVTNRAVTVAARPEEIWPWLAQMGESPRGGFYSYEWIERLMMMRVLNAERIIPQYQNLRAGDVLDRSGNIEVKALEPGHWLVLGPPDTKGAWGASTWCLALYPIDEEGTRLVSRVRARIDRWTPFSVALLLMLDPGQFLMERKMLLGIKRRAEALASDRKAKTEVFENVLLDAMKYA